MYKLISIVFTFSVLFNAKSTESPIIAMSSNHQKVLDQDGQFSLLNYNLWGLPIELEGHDQKHRFKNLPESIREMGADIICMQECFDHKLRHQLSKNLLPYYNCVADIKSNRRLLGLLNMDKNGGLLTISKFPIIAEQFIPFHKIEGRNIIEKIGAKGFLVTTINLGIDTINVINTHMYSGNSEHSEAHRVAQVKQLGETLDTLLQRLPYGTILTGDLNIAHPMIHKYNDDIVPSPSYHYLTNDLCLEDSTPDIDEEDFTMTPLFNKYSSGHDGGHQKLDYCMLSCVAGTPMSFASSEVVFKGDDALSDHMGLWSEIVVHSKERMLAQNIVSE